jgi:cell division septation protein DedD
VVDVVRVIAIALVLTACDGEPQVVAAAVEPVAEPDTLLALALVNDPDLANARPYRERHALIDELAPTEDAKRIDQRLNLALDLRQAGQAPDPCRAYEGALAQIEARADAWFASHVREAGVPGGCHAVLPRRESVLASLTATPRVEVEPTPEVVPATQPEPEARSKKPRRGKTLATAPSKPDPATTPPASEPATKPETGIASKIDEELKPFGL